MKSGISPQIAGGVLALVLVIVAVLAWKFVFAGPQSTMPDFSKNPQLLKQYNDLHSKSAADVMADQKRRLEAVKARGSQ